VNFTPKAAASRGHIRALELTSMIDVIFLLLIYFVLTTTYQPPESRLSPALVADTSASGRSEMTAQIVEVVMVEGKPGFRVGSRVLCSRQDLTALLRELPLQQGLIVRGSDAVTTEWGVMALQAARDAGFTKVTYVPTR